LRATGLKLDPSYYLPEPKGAAQEAPANWHVAFSPPKSPSQAAHDVVAVQDLKAIPKRKKTIPLSMISLAVFILGISGYAIWQKLPHPLDLNATSTTPRASSDRNSLSLPEKVVTPGQPINGWAVHLDDKNRQQIGINLDPFKQPFLYFSSKKADKAMTLFSSWVSVNPGEKWAFEAALQKKKDFVGEATLVIMLQQSGGTIVSNFVSLKIPPPQISGLSKIEEQFIIPEKSTMIRLALTGNFSGKLLILKPKLFFPKIEIPPPINPALIEEPETKPAGEPTDTWAQKTQVGY
jgi:hypothetical protein